MALRSSEPALGSIARPVAIRTLAWTPVPQDVAPPDSASSEKKGEPEHAVTGQTSNEARVGQLRRPGSGAAEAGDRDEPVE